MMCSSGRAAAHEWQQVQIEISSYSSLWQQQQILAGDAMTPLL